MSKITLMIFVVMFVFCFFSFISNFNQCYASRINVSSNLSQKSNQDELGEIIRRASYCECVKKILGSFNEENKEVNDAIATGSEDYLSELVHAYKQESINSYENGNIIGGVYYHYFSLRIMKQVMIKFPEHFPKGFVTKSKIKNLENKIKEKLALLSSFKKNCQAD